MKVIMKRVFFCTFIIGWFLIGLHSCGEENYSGTFTMNSLAGKWCRVDSSDLILVYHYYEVTKDGKYADYYNKGDGFARYEDGYIINVGDVNWNLEYYTSFDFEEKSQSAFYLGSKVCTIQRTGIDEAVVTGWIQGTFHRVKGFKNKDTEDIIKLRTTEINLFECENQQIYVEFNSDSIIWKSANEDIAFVDKKGNVSAISPGSTTISATVGKQTASIPVTISPWPEAQFTISVSSIFSSSVDFSVKVSNDNYYYVGIISKDEADAFDNQKALAVNMVASIESGVRSGYKRKGDSFGTFINLKPSTNYIILAVTYNSLCDRLVGDGQCVTFQTRNR